MDGYLLLKLLSPILKNVRLVLFLKHYNPNGFIIYIGVETITPIICNHSERKIIKKGRFEKILQSATKQSLNCYLPKLNDAIAFKDFITQNFTGDLFIAHCEETDKKPLKNELKPKTNITVLIGPEGDFSVKEIAQALQNGFKPVTLGETRLRTETAAIVACHSVAFINE